MIRIRLMRIGKKNRPAYRVVLTPKQVAAKGGGFIEILGNYDPVKKIIKLEKEKILYWISKGAQCSTTVHNLLVKNKVLDKPKIKINIKVKEKEASASVKLEGVVEDVSKQAVTPKEELVEKAE